MDYCSTCRRHLNGALVCPGCGAYAPDIAPGVVDGRTVPGTAGSAGPAVTVAPSGRTDAGRPGDGTTVGPAPAEEVPSDGVPPAVSAPTGRAARRRQLARWKKTRRRALVATAVALVGGGLALASTDRGTGDRAQASAAPDVTGMGGARGPADPGDPGAPGSATPPGARPSAPGGSAQSRSPSSGAGERRSDGAAPASTAASGTRADGAAAARTPVPARPRTTASASAPETAIGSDASGSGGSGAAVRPQAPPPAAGGTDGTGGADRGDAPPSPATPSAPSATSPDASRLCLLVVCLG
ncbi:SCO2400 family protein [Streptomyces griseomycini]|uniref:Uncharacterized protein n=1 Tax=Streptomyces griseomycini TaxID=66895 RepID=A0A7W7PP33_9ACTN|nr:hypothetical protein [Streptomyces griseomycini]MBB4898056.1 hypothetical protein [Streptomyces griseomycini]GGR31961.1 hypothetical protein GCM10015536_41990 [Streptomyces griseomycini]